MQSCYVMQDDYLLEYLTARETLAMSVELRTSTHGRKKISQIVEEALDLWGLQVCANTLARSLSGGEKKRLVIAQELMSDVPVVFLDEPTSGLDSCWALRCVQVLRTLADNGRTVLCSVHSPSARVFAQFDRLYMLSDGRCIYNGLTEHLVPFLSSQNLRCPAFCSPSDFVTDVASGVHGDLAAKLSTFFIPDESSAKNTTENCEQGLVTIYGGRLMTNKEKNDEARLHRVEAKSSDQFMTLLKRFLCCHVRNKCTSFARIAANLYFAFLLSITYYNSGNRTEQVRDIIAMYFAIMVILLFQSFTPILLTFPLEIKVLIKEQRSCCYKPSLYFIARIICELPFLIGGTVLMMTIVHWTTCQPMEFYRIAIVLLFCFVFCSATESISYAASTFFSLETVVFMAAPVLSPIILFSGFFVQTQYMLPVVAWLPYLSHMYYAHRAVMFALYGGGRGELECDGRGDGDKICVPVDGSHVLDVIGASDVNLLANFLAMLGIDIFMKLFAFCLLKWRLWRKR